jgi:hypothetical protein
MLTVLIARSIGVQLIQHGVTEIGRTSASSVAARGLYSGSGRHASEDKTRPRSMIGSSELPSVGQLTYGRRAIGRYRLGTRQMSDLFALLRAHANNPVIIRRRAAAAIAIAVARYTLPSGPTSTSRRRPNWLANRVSVAVTRRPSAAPRSSVTRTAGFPSTEESDRRGRCRHRRERWLASTLARRRPTRHWRAEAGNRLHWPHGSRGVERDDGAPYPLDADQT